MKLATKAFRRNDWYVTSPYGKRKDPITKKTATHWGTDYGTHCKKWPLYAIEDGYVQLVTRSKTGYGNRIWIRYPRINKSIMYAHMDSIKLKKGDKVKDGTLAGYTGTTGKSTGIHLHMGMTKIGSDKWENPHAYDYQPPAPKPAPKPTPTPPAPTPTPTKLKVGDKVKIMKPGNANAAGTGKKAGGIGWTRYIKKIHSGKAYPYQVGNDSGTTGFYKESALKKL